MGMKSKMGGFVLLIAALALTVTFAPAYAAAPAPENVTLTVTAVGKQNTSAPAVTREDVQFYLRKERTQIANWRRGEKLYLAVLIDDSLDTAVASQWSDLKQFFNAQPPTTYISVAYARNGVAMLAQNFTNNHGLAAKALRFPLGSGAFSSPYLALQDLMKRWPSSGDRRSILLISSGIDYLRGISLRASTSIPPSSELKNRISTFGRSIFQIEDAGRAGSSL
jgi:hypothetical protein